MSGTARTCNLLTLAGYGCSRFVGQEARPVGQHAVQNHGELAGEPTFALRMPARAAKRIPQLFNVEPLEMRPMTSVSPD